MQKKVLSLVLCLAMMFSIMVVGAGAAFVDDAKIVHKEAVDGCVALNIINGIEKDGVVSYKPAQNVTRAEMCKMIFVALNGGKSPNLGAASKVSFVDTKDHWGAAYIEYCVQKGIVAGFGDGQFKPNDSVTTTQAAKMLLIALGYDAKTEGYIGANWDLNVNLTASQKGLYNELEDIVFTDPLNRDDAAQMIWNALQIKEVKYETTWTTENGKPVAVNKAVPTDKTLLKNKYDATVIDAGLLTSVKAGTKDGTYDVKVGDKQVGYIVAQDCSALLGQNVKVIDKENGTDYGVIADKDSSVVGTGILANIDTSDNTAKIDGKEIKFDKSFKCIYNFEDGMTHSYPTKAPYNNPYNNISLIDNNNDGKVDSIVLTPVIVAKVTNVAKDGTLTTDNTLVKDVDKKSYVAYDGIAKNDWVVVTYKDNSVSGKYEVAKADIVSGKVTAVNDTDKQVWIDDTAYTYQATDFKTSNIGTSCDSVLYNGYLLKPDFTQKDNTAVENIVYVKAVDKKEAFGKTDVIAQIVKASDGTTETVVVSKVDSLTAVFESPKAKEKVVTPALYTFKVVDGKYELTTIGNGTGKALAGFDEYVTSSIDYNSEKGTLGAYDIADDAVVFLTVTGKDMTVVTGKDLKAYSDITAASALVLKPDGKFPSAGVIVATSNGALINSDALFGYITAKRTVADSKIEYTILVNGKAETYLSESNVASVNEPVSFKVSGENTVTFVGTTFTDAAILIPGTDRVNMKTESGVTATYYITKDTQIFYVDTAEKTMATTGDMPVAETNAKGDEYYLNAAFNADGKNNLNTLYVYTNGRTAADGTVAVK